MSVNNAFGCVAGYVLYDCGKVTGSDEQFGCIKRYFTLGGTMFMNQLDETFEYLFLTIYSFGLFLQEQVLKTAEHKQGIENAFDENLDTFWHAQWGDAGKLKNHPNGISVEMTLKEAKEIAKLTYIPKAGDTGTVGNYIIEAATGTDDAGKTVWKEVCSGTFKNQGNSEK